jgi:hypothetical protein
MRTSVPFVRSLLNFARQILDEASASTLSVADLSAIEAIYSIMGQYLKRNDQDLLASLMLTDLFDTQFEGAPAATHQPAMLIAGANASIDIALKVLESVDAEGSVHIPTEG